MEGSQEVEALAAELARAVELTMNPSISQNDRLEAYTACERYASVICTINETYCIIIFL